jgi:aminotransferase
MLRDVVSEREKELPISTIGELIRIAEEEKDIVSLGPGEPDFATPQHIIDFSKKKLDEGFTHYSAAAGRKELRQAITEKLAKDNHVNVSEDQVLVTVGSTEGLLLALMCTIDPGEGVMIPDPGFLAYKPMTEVLNGLPISVPLCEEKIFQFDVELAKKMIIPEKTNVFILNTPPNPTGVVFNKKNLEEIAQFAVEYDLLILSDEAYEKLVYGVKHISIGSLNGMEDRVVTLQTFSKSYAMPGFRLGYAAGPEKLIKAMTKLRTFTTVCAPTMSQLAGLEALRGEQESVEKMRKDYDLRRKYICKRVKNIRGFSCVEPNGAFYLFPNIKSFDKSSYDFAKFLLEKAKVAVVPGTEFGRCGEGYIRMSYATSMEKIKIALDRIEDATEKLGFG